MTPPLSIRFSPSLLARLRQRANAMTGASAAGLAQRLIDEGLRMADHPGVIFKDGPSGRRAALAYGPDVWEVIKFLREVDERGPAAIDGAAPPRPDRRRRGGIRGRHQPDRHGDQLLRGLRRRNRRGDSRRRRGFGTCRSGVARPAAAHRMNQRPDVRLLLDEMFSPAIAA